MAVFSWRRIRRAALAAFSLESLALWRHETPLCGAAALALSATTYMGAEHRNGSARVYRGPNIYPGHGLLETARTLTNLGMEEPSLNETALDEHAEFSPGREAWQYDPVERNIGSGDFPSDDVVGQPFEVVVNNLGGMGPDNTDGSPKELRLRHLTSASGVWVDLVVTNLSTYVPGSPTANGARGPFGLISVANDTSVRLLFAFDVEAPGLSLPVRLHSVFLSLIELDEDDGMTGQVSVTMGGAESVFLAKHSDISTSTAQDSRVSFLWKELGEKEEDPTDPMDLSKKQAARTVTVHYREISELVVDVGVVAAATGRNGDVATNCSNGRTIQFTGMPSLATGGTSVELDMPASDGSSASIRATRTTPLEVVVSSEAEPSGAADNLVAYWDLHGCGKLGPQKNSAWCVTNSAGEPQGTVGCQHSVPVGSDVCPLGIAYLQRMFGSGSRWSVIIDGCVYAWYATYECSPPAPRPSDDQNPFSLQNESLQDVVQETNLGEEKHDLSKVISDILSYDNVTTTSETTSTTKEANVIVLGVSFLYAPVEPVTETTAGAISSTCPDGFVAVMNTAQLNAWIAGETGVTAAAVEVARSYCFAPTVPRMMPVTEDISKQTVCTNIERVAPVEVFFVIRPQLKIPIEVIQAVKAMNGSISAEHLNSRVGSEGSFVACSDVIVVENSLHHEASDGFNEALDELKQFEKAEELTSNRTAKKEKSVAHFVHHEEARKTFFDALDPDRFRGMDQGSILSTPTFPPTTSAKPEPSQEKRVPWGVRAVDDLLNRNRIRWLTRIWKQSGIPW
eukprot:TRINITY_DN7302_c0_g1_i2.p1 TRINITY_DN7302_c0_g1~~TRINITY_DN7302_c0_g1_i2.p1  ORF type:complete len:822 (-),score=129.68 TRINITY_DN7302_c0_g1_i2:277-2661(-)